MTTNAGAGYTLYARHTGAPTSSSYTLADLASASNAEVAFDSAPVSSQITRLGIQVGISGLTKAVSYTATVIYTAAPVF